MPLLSELREVKSYGGAVRFEPELTVKVTFNSIDEIEEFKNSELFLRIAKQAKIIMELAQ